MSGGNAYKRKSHRRIEVITSVAAVVVLYVILESFGVTMLIRITAMVIIMAQSHHTQVQD